MDSDSWASNIVGNDTALSKEELQLLGASARAFFSAKASLAHRRAAQNTSTEREFILATWKMVAEMGWLGTAVSEPLGGWGAGYDALGLITKEAGRTLYNSPLIETAWVCGPMLANAKRLQGRFNAMLDGHEVTVLAHEEGDTHQERPENTVAHTLGDGYVLSGRKSFVPFGMLATSMIVSAQVGGDRSTPPKPACFLVDAAAPGVAREALELIDPCQAAIVEFDSVKLSAESILNDDSEADLLRALDRGRIAVACEMIGVATEALERTVDYVKTRIQFGQTISSFQSVRHRNANAFCQLEIANAVTSEALRALNSNTTKAAIPALASHAKASAGEALHIISRLAIQLHGGIGMTQEFEIGQFLKRAQLLENLYGNTAYHLSRYLEISRQGHIQ